MRGVGGRKARGKLRTGICFSPVDCYRLAIVFDHLMELTHTVFFLKISWQWSKFTDSASFFRFHHHYYYGRVFVHTLTQWRPSHTHQELKFSLTWPRHYCRCVILQVLPWFDCIFHDFPAHKNWGKAAGLLEFALHHKIETHTVTYTHGDTKWIAFFHDLFVVGSFTRTTTPPRIFFSSGSRQSIDAFSTHRQDPIYPAL